MKKEIKILDHGYVKYIDHMGTDESVIEAARMSTGKGFLGWDTDAKLLEYLYSNKHMTPFECGGELQLEVQAPIFIFRQWHRHRTQCLSGDTKIYFEKKDNYKLKDLYYKWQSNINERDHIKNMNLCCLNEINNTFIYTHINDVIFSGEKDVFEVKLESGKSIKCSSDHKFLFGNGWGSLKDKIELLLVNKKAIWKDGNHLLTINNESNNKAIYWLYEPQKKIPKIVEKISDIQYVGKEPCYDISVDGPFHNFVANGIVTHNSFNEMSARYTKMPNLHYIPDSKRLTKQNKVNKQGSTNELLPEETRNKFIMKMKSQQDEIYSFYEQSVKKDKLAKEIARLNCPVSRYSRMRAKTDLRNWLHFLGLRMDKHAQWEIREYANAVAEIVKEIWPRTFELFEEYSLYSVTLSRTERKDLYDFLIKIPTTNENITKIINKLKY